MDTLVTWKVTGITDVTTKCLLGKAKLIHMDLPHYQPLVDFYGSKEANSMFS